MDNRLIKVATQAYLDGGLSIIPINPRTKKSANWLLPQATNEQGEPLFWKRVQRGDGSEISVSTTENTGAPKRGWKEFARRRPTPVEVEAWLKAGIRSIAMVAGPVSGNAEVLDFDNHNGVCWFDDWVKLAGDPRDYGLPLQQTGSGYGRQIAWRCDVIEGSQKLALTPAADEPAGHKTMIETRGGQGDKCGIALLPPSLHPSGNHYELLYGRFSQIPRISPEVRAHFLACARQLSQVQLSERNQKATESATFNDSGANEVVAAYNRKYSIESALQRYNYTQQGDRWSRPGKADSLGVTIFDDGKAYAYSSNDRLAADRCGVGDKRPFTAFDLFAYYDHNEDYAAATRAAAVELGMAYENSLHTMIFVEGYDNAAAVRETMFQHGWVARGFRPDKINLDGVSKYSTVIVWAYTDWMATQTAAMIPGAYPLAVPNGLDALAMQRDGILQPYLDAALADARKQPEVMTWTL